ncbi:major facilitator superfamily protein [Colletotrichum truncatum]|uniref:Major facilitator superfamily protein n=1 Tax=Colletotrichum truncatum TaxID=5467 RepID=A0ACC3Z2V6_COLTU|nr:major facilitator superfamily protein [Colletotrichum truncatum]KAF6793244.1 major facilitator superfamily protein [Colletotrichum truncatum]
MASPNNAIKIPGTVQLVDTHGTLDTDHENGESTIVLIPQPSGDPKDPLSWTQNRKTLNIFCVMIWCFFAAAIISGLSPAYLQIEKDTGISVADLSTGNGLLYLFLGWGTLITQNFALKHGRRPTLFFSILLATFVNLWSAYIHSRTEFFINRIMLGIVSSPMETLIEVVIDDLFFVHQRGFYMGIYSWTLWCGALLCPVASGFVAENLGWRWIQYILSILGGCVTISTFLLFEETMFHRTGVDTDVIESVELRSGIAETANQVLDNDQSSQKKGCSTQQIGNDNITNADSGVSINISYSNHTPVNSGILLSKLKLWGHEGQQKRSMFKHALVPFLLLRFPTVLFSGVLVGGILSWYNVVGGSLALILGNPPYNFSSNVVGLFYLASVIGVSIGCVISGWASDRLPITMSRRHGGVMEPEYRLWLCAIAIVAHPVGCILYGVGASYEIHWIGIAFGFGFISITLPLGTSLAFTYILDSFKEFAGEGFVSVILIRNSMGFAFSYAVVPMINNIGLRSSFILTAVLGFALWALGLSFIYFGKSFRRRAAEPYWKMVEKHSVSLH